MLTTHKPLTQAIRSMSFRYLERLSARASGRVSRVRYLDDVWYSSERERECERVVGNGNGDAKGYISSSSLSLYSASTPSTQVSSLSILPSLQVTSTSVTENRNIMSMSIKRSGSEIDMYEEEPDLTSDSESESGSTSDTYHPRPIKKLRTTSRELSRPKSPKIGISS